MRRALIIAVSTVTILSTGIAVTRATPADRATRTEISKAVMADGGMVDIQPGTETQVLHVSIEPGGSTGWHSHPDAGVFIVDSGALTNYGLDGGACEGVTVPAGEAAFVPPHPDHAHLGRNEGTEPLEITVMYFNVPPGGSSRADAEPPPECPADLR